MIPNRPLFHRILEEGFSLEWARQREKLKGHAITSIYFGGGTPSLAPAIIERVLHHFPNLDCEITVEANPEESDLDLFSRLRSFGVNRLSLGVQSLDDRSLQSLDRRHTAQKAIEAIWAAEEAGFRNISIDLMYDLPDQTEASWLYTLARLPDLPIQHLSLYNLTIEPHTSFFKKKETLRLPDPMASLRLLEHGVQAIESAGLQRYEISAFAKPGYESRHNLGYWTARPFLGFGPSAFSYWEGTRWRNIANLQRYTRRLKENLSPIDFSEQLPSLQREKELFAVQIRILVGVEVAAVPRELETVVDRLIGDHLLHRVQGRIQLTEKGLLFYDTVASELM